MSETDKEFVADMEWLHSHDREAALPPEKLARLFALARRGADAADEIERLKAELLERDAVWLPEKDAEIERLRAALAHADAKGQENDRLLWGTIKDNERLRAALEAWNHAVRIDVLMEGPRYMGVSGEAGKRAWEMTRAALKEDGDA